MEERRSLLIEIAFVLVGSQHLLLLDPNAHVNSSPFVVNERDCRNAREEDRDPETHEAKLKASEEGELVKVDETAKDGREVVEGEGERAYERRRGEPKGVVEIVELERGREGEISIKGGAP